MKFKFDLAISHPDLETRAKLVLDINKPMGAGEAVLGLGDVQDGFALTRTLELPDRFSAEDLFSRIIDIVEDAGGAIGGGFSVEDDDETPG